MSKAHNAAQKNLRVRLTAFRNILASEFAANHVFVTDAGSQTAAQLVAQLDAALGHYTAVDKQRTVLAIALKARKAAEPAAQVLGARVLATIRVQFPRTHPKLKETFLRLPGGPHKMNAGKKFLANIKRQASRKKLGVRGKRQRAALLKSP